MNAVARNADIPSAMFPLSFAQERLWMIDRLTGGSVAYNVPTAVRIFGRLDSTVLRRALDAVVSRHETLRTAIVDTNEGPRQVVHEAATLPLSFIDVSDVDRSCGEERVRRHIVADATTPFDFRTAPLARCLIIRLAPEEHVVQLVAHHLVCDAWSLAVLVREVGCVYEGGSLESLPVQYADYAIWQRRRATSQEWRRQREYWRQQLDGASAVSLPHDRMAASMVTSAAAHLRFGFDHEETEALRGLADRTGSTLFMILVAGFKAVVAAYTGETDIAIGTPVVDRPKPELEPLVGLFLNTVVLRTDVGGRPTFRQLLGRVKEVCLHAFANQELPYEQVVEALHPGREADRNPLFELLLTLQNAPHQELRFGGLASRRENSASGEAKFDIAVFHHESADGLSGSVEYRRELFGASRIEELVAYYRALLLDAARDPDRPVGCLARPDARESEEVLGGWNRTDRSLAGAHGVCGYFERAADGCPDAIALVCGETQLTFLGLDVQANRLAHYLRRRGIGPESRVGVCLEREPLLPIAMLAVLKVGAAFVPLEPAYPSARLRGMVEDSGMTLVLTSTAACARLGLSEGDARILRLDREAAAIACESEQRLPSEVDPLNVAYIVYTSGSTGQPKGVALSHAALSNLIEWYADGTHEGPALQFASVGFDASFLEMHGPWSRGTAVYIASETVRVDPRLLARYVERHAIEKVFVPVVVLQRLAEVCEGNSSSCCSLREIITAGEQLRITPVVRRLFAQLPACRLHNYYGPSETHDATAWRVEGDPADWPTLPPIGYPLWNVRCYVLNDEMKPAVHGAVGELYIGGAGLARGYWDRPDLTAERFLPDPSRIDGARLYRTGDLARRLPTGALQFLGRADRQIKIRGCRVEPREIETVLLEDAELRESAVAVDHAHDEARLVAYVVPRVSPPPTAAVIRARLRSQLPEYMVPAAIAVVDALPLTNNGKVNFAALTALPSETAVAVAPRTIVEQAIARACAESIGRPEVGVEDNLFEIGAHSLSVAQLANRLSHWFGVEIPVSSVFRHPTVAALAAVVSDLVGPAADQAAEQALSASPSASQRR